MKQNIINICKTAPFDDILKNKGYAFFNKGKYNLNIIGIRRDGNKVTNEFDDALVVIHHAESGNEIRYWYPITTEPGIIYMKDPIGSKGTAILVPGQYRGAWKIGLHQGKYKALTQCKSVKVYRDGNKDNIYDFDSKTIDEGIFGINIHKAGAASIQVDKWSAGCQVFANTVDFNHFMKLCDKQVENGYGKFFTYTLLTEKEILEYING